MLEHLIGDEVYIPPVWDHMSPPPKHLSKVDAPTLLDAQFNTVQLLEEIRPDHEVTDPLASETAGAVFNALADPETPEAFKVDSAKMLRTPDAVKHLIAMLTAYEWNFVEEATRIRGYLVAQLMEETKNANPRIRLRAIEMLGKITEVALFTERVEVKTSNISDEELAERLRQRLSRALTRDAEVIDSVDSAAVAAVSLPAPGSAAAVGAATHASA